MKADVTNSLSAKGSKNIPKVVTKLYFLAIIPSKQSVIAAITKTTKAKILVQKESIVTKTINIGTNKTLNIVNLFAKFINKFLKQILRLYSNT